MPLEPHIPSWKRLGLKLKFAKDEPPLDSPIVDSKKRKAEDALLSEQYHKLDHTSRATKRAKASPTSATNGHKAVNREDEYDDYNAKTTTQTHANGEEESAKTPTATKPKPRDRKSVSFTPGTKEADGQSMKNLYQAWVKTQQNGIDSEDGIVQHKSNRSIVASTEAAGEGQDGQLLGEATTSPEETVGASTASGDVSSNLDSTNDANPPTPRKSKKKKKKGTKKSKTTRLTSTPSSSSSSHPPPDTSSSNLSPPPSSTPFPPAPHPPPSSHPSSTPTATALTYLTTFHTSPSTWKFSKNHQTSLLKHILSLAKIPPKHNPALLAYLKGLQGRSAKGDLRKRALEARQADEVWLADKKENGDTGEGDTVAGMDGTPKEQYESQWRGKLTALLRKNSEQQAGLQSTDNNNTASTHDDDDDNADDDNDDKAKALEWRINRRVRAELILVAIGDTSASPSPEPAPKPSSITANNATATTAIRSSVAASIGGKQHIKFDDDDDDDGTAVVRNLAGDDGVPNKPGRSAAAPAATANNRSSNQPKKRKRKRKSRIRTAGRNSDSEKSSSSSDSSSSG